MDTSFVALLRGINLGGTNRILMNDLAALFTAVQCEGVTTFIQSGNVLFRAKADILEGLEARVSKLIHNQFGFNVPVILRGKSELEDEFANNPFLSASANPKDLHILFLADKPSEQAVASLEPDRSPPDEFAVRGRAVYLKLPNGAGRTKLSNQYFDAKLGTISTGRNWNTAGKILELLRKM